MGFERDEVPSRVEGGALVGLGKAQKPRKRFSPKAKELILQPRSHRMQVAPVRLFAVSSAIRFLRIIKAAHLFQVRRFCDGSFAGRIILTVNELVDRLRVLCLILRAQINDGRAVDILVTIAAVHRHAMLLQ